MQAVLFLNLRSQGRSLDVSKQIEIPFAPIPGMYLGFSPESAFNEDCEVVDRVLWNLVTKVWHIELKGHGFADSSVPVALSYIRDDGWDLYLNLKYDSLDDAMMDWDTPESVGWALAEMPDGKFYWVDREELAIIRLQYPTATIHGDHTHLKYN